MIIADNLILIAAPQHVPFFGLGIMQQKLRMETTALQQRTAMPPCNAPNELRSSAFSAAFSAAFLQVGLQVGLQVVQRNAPHFHLVFKVLGIFKHPGYFGGSPPQQGTLS